MPTHSLSNSDINTGIDRRFWGLDPTQSAKLCGLYDEGKVLAAKRLNIQRDLEASKKKLLGQWPEITQAMIDEALFRDEYEAEMLEEQAEEQQLIVNANEDFQALKEQLRATNDQLTNVATRCSRLELCPSLTSIILSKLPRELRDHIYDFLWSDEDIEELDAAISFIPNVVTVHDQPAVDLLQLPVPPYGNSDFVGIEFATEVAMRYFRALTGAAVDYRCVRAHLNRNLFGPMRLPIKEAIKSVVITISRMTYCNYGTVFAAKALADSLDSLFILRHHRNLSIEIYLDQTIQYKTALFQILEIIRPFFFQFRDAKMDVKVLGHDFFNPIDDNLQDVFSEQLNHYFDRTPEEWLDMKAEEIKAIPERRQRRACRGILRAMRKNLAFFNADIRKNEDTEAG